MCERMKTALLPLLEEAAEIACNSSSSCVTGNKCEQQVVLRNASNRLSMSRNVLLGQEEIRQIISHLKKKHVL